MSSSSARLSVKLRVRKGWRELLFREVACDCLGRGLSEWKHMDDALCYYLSLPHAGYSHPSPNLPDKFTKIRALFVFVDAS